MAQLKGTITVTDGKVVRVDNATDDNLAVIRDADLAEVLSNLSCEGWQLVGDYQLEVTKFEETDEERRARFETQSKSARQGTARVSARKPQKP